MELDKLQISPRLRSGWQAIDLGFLLASRWYRALFLSATIPALLLFLPLAFIFSDNPIWAGIIIWWLKPFWERQPVQIASHSIFADNSLQQQVLLGTWQSYRKDFLPWLLWRRLSLYRAFDTPVSLLENLTGKARSKRLTVLHGKHTDIAFCNQLVCFCFEVIITCGLVITFIFFIPDSFDLEIMDSVEQLTLTGAWIYTIAAFVAMLLVIPFHSMAGFALYLNRRIELEAWDIEITFRSLAERKREASSRLLASLILPLCSGFLLLASSDPALAVSNHNRDSAKQLIEQVLAGNDFGEEKTVRKWRFKNWAEENEDRIPEWMIKFVEWFEDSDGDGFKSWGELLSSTAFWLKLLLIGLFCWLLLYLFYRYRGPLGRFVANRKKAEVPEIMFGLDVRPESLPDDVPAQVMQLWRSEQSREALGLLYRATLSRLIEHHALEFKSSHTEAECADLVSAYGNSKITAFFVELTRVWRRMAYGHLRPDTEVLQLLCDHWSQEMANDPQ